MSAIATYGGFEARAKLARELDNLRRAFEFLLSATEIDDAARWERVGRMALVVNAATHQTMPAVAAETLSDALGCLPADGSPFDNLRARLHLARAVASRETGENRSIVASSRELTKRQIGV